MISGSRNIRYLAYGKRNYGIKPILSKPRGLWEFQFILSGRAQPTTRQGIDANVYGTRLYIAHPLSSHGWQDEPQGTSEVFVMHFMEVPEELSICIDAEELLCVGLDAEQIRSMAEHMIKIKSYSGRYDIQTSMHLQELLFAMTRLVADKNQTKSLLPNSHDKAKRALHWLTESIHLSPTVEMAASTVGVSPTHLRRLFLEAGYKSPKVELIRLKMESAKHGLLQGWSQKYIANYLGYSDVGVFARAFRKSCGIPPGNWLKMQKSD